jgi:hypothetical protein
MRELMVMKQARPSATQTSSLLLILNRVSPCLAIIGPRKGSMKHRWRPFAFSIHGTSSYLQMCRSVLLRLASAVPKLLESCHGNFLNRIFRDLDCFPLLLVKIPAKPYRSMVTMI